MGEPTVTDAPARATPGGPPSTGPVWHALEGSFELVLANARDVRNVPGRKTDVKDSEWIADLLAHGLIRGSFVPRRREQLEAPRKTAAARGLSELQVIVHRGN